MEQQSRAVGRTPEGKSSIKRYFSFKNGRVPPVPPQDCDNSNDARLISAHSEPPDSFTAYIAPPIFLTPGIRLIAAALLSSSRRGADHHTRRHIGGWRTLVKASIQLKVIHRGIGILHVISAFKDIKIEEVYALWPSGLWPSPSRIDRHKTPSLDSPDPRGRIRAGAALRFKQ
jgi:hypothetical protein